MEKFTAIDRNIRGQHNPVELIFLADQIIKLPIRGPIIECGCWKGASSAKLSHVAAFLGVDLYICDSFSGLPPQEETHTRVDGKKREFKSGEFAGTLDEVRENISRWGRIEKCRFVQGFFCDTLPALDVCPAAVFMDVDYVSSARDCLKYLWPRLLPGGRFFTHEAAFIEFVEGITEGTWWHREIGGCAPPLFGAGHGVSAGAPYLAYFRKPQSEPTPAIELFTIEPDRCRRD